MTFIQAEVVPFRCTSPLCGPDMVLAMFIIGHHHCFSSSLGLNPHDHTPSPFTLGVGAPLADMYYVFFFFIPNQNA